MGMIAKLAGLAALGLTIVPAILVVAGTVTLDANKSLMNVGMLLWFGSVGLGAWAARKRA